MNKWILIKKETSTFSIVFVDSKFEISLINKDA